jgi:hypothetical protein
MTGKYDYALYFEEDKTARYEPRGYIDSGVTINSSDTGTRVKEFEQDSAEGYFNKVRVISNKTNLEGTASDIKSGDNAIVKEIRADWAETQSELDMIAQEVLDNAKNTRLRVVVPEFTSDLRNEQITFNYSRLGVNNLKLVVEEQINKYPDKTSELVCGYSERRSELLTDTGLNVGGQGLTNADTGEDNANTSSSENQENPNVSGISGTSGIDTEYDRIDKAVNLADGATDNIQLSLSSLNGDTEYTLIHVFLSVEPQQLTTTGYDLFLANNDTAQTYLSLSDLCESYSTFSTTFLAAGDIEGDTLQLEISNSSGNQAVVGYGMSASQISEHDHTSGTFNADNHVHNVQTTDSGHQNHGVTGQTDSKNVNATELNKKDR